VPLALLLAVLAMVPAVPALAACPQTVTDCFGAATAFKIVADKLMASRGSIGSEGFVTVLGSDIGDACTGTAFVGGPSCDVTNARNLVLTAGGGIAATFAGYPCASDGTPAGIGASFVGDVVTGGGRLRNQDAITVTGIVDVTGTDPRIPGCIQAQADMGSAGSALAALAPTRSLGVIRLVPVGGSTSMTLTADPGVNVWTADSINLASKRNNFGEVHRSTLVIALDPATDSVVIDVRRVRVGRYSGLVVSGDPAKVVLNLPAGGSVRNRSGKVQPWIVGPEASVSVKTNGETDSGPLGVFAERVSVLGAVVR
jgi:hypothetical protein